MAAETRALVVTGATGKQGGALIRALLAKPSQPFQIYAVTRNAQSKGAKALAGQPNVHVIEGNFDQPKAIFAKVQDPWGLFSVTTLEMGKKDAALTEESQGKAMTQAALDAGIKHILYTSVDRGVDSDHQETPVPHFRSKKHVEDDIIERSKTSGASWTFIRPVAFMDNLTNDFGGKGFVTVWRQNGLDRKLQFISSGDIGRVAAEALLHADEPEYRNKAISIAADEISPNEAAQVFQEATGKKIPSTFGFVGTVLKALVGDELSKMFAWFKTDGYAIDVPALRQKYPFMKDFRTWLDEESDWKKETR